MSVEWSYYKKFDYVNKKFLPDYGEGDTMAMQVVTAVTKLVYRWYNDGDVFDNRYGMDGWVNDISSYANWLYRYFGKGAAKVLDKIETCSSDDEYELILKKLADALLDEETLELLNKFDKVGSIYKCDGKFKFEEHDDDEDEDGLYW